MLVGGQQAVENGNNYFFLVRGMERKENGAVYRVQSPQNVGGIRSHSSGAERCTSARLAFESALC